MSTPSFSIAVPNGVDLNNPWCRIAFALSVLGALPPLVMSILKVLREPEIQAAGRWMALAARRAWAAVQASLKVPNPRRRRPIADMALTLMEGTLYYLYALTFTAWFVFGILVVAERWGTLSPAKYAVLFVYDMAMALLVRFYAERGRRIRVDLRRRWRGIQHRRWQAAMAMACVPLGITLISIGTEFLRGSNAAA
jgi:hypothetical protein